MLSCNRGAVQERMNTAPPKRSPQDLEFSVGRRLISLDLRLLLASGAERLSAENEAAA